MFVGDPKINPFSSRNVSVTAFTLLPGFTIATPMLRPILGITSMNIEASVAIIAGPNPACDCTAPLLIVPYVNVTVGASDDPSGVITRYPDLTSPRSTSLVSGRVVGTCGVVKVEISPSTFAPRR